MDKKDICVRKALPEDARLLYEWAMDPSVRKNAFNQENFSFENHKKWLDKKLADPDSLILIFYIKEYTKENTPANTEERIETGSETGNETELILEKRAQSPSGEVPVGQVRLDIEDGAAEIDYSVDRAMRGKGFGKDLLKKAVKNPEILNKPIRYFRGIVKEENIPSQKAFEAAGFVNKGKKLINDLQCYIYELERLQTC